MTAEDATEPQKAREWWRKHWDHTRALLWSIIGLGLVLLPFIACHLCLTPACDSEPHPCGVALTALWAVGGGVLGALLNVGRLRMSTQKREPRIERGLGLEPAIGAGVALIAYLAFVTQQITIFPVTEAGGSPTFERVLLLGLLAGLLWEPLLVRIELLAQQDKKPAGSGTQDSSGGST